MAQNIRYVAVYLGNGGLEPNSAQSILDNHYGDCKDHVTILEALLAAKGIASSPVLIGAGAVRRCRRFRCWAASTTPSPTSPSSICTWIRPRHGRASDSCRKAIWGAGGAHRDATLARTPANTPDRNATSMEVRFTFDANGDLRGETIPKLGENAEIGMRAQFSQLNAQNRARAEEQIMAASGFDGRGRCRSRACQAI